MDADGTNVTRVTNNPDRDSEPQWGPGNRIAFFSIGQGDADIYTMKPDGTDLRRITTNAGHNIHAAWSPDGKRIAFVSTRAGDYDVYVMNADGSGVVRLTYGPTPNWIPNWSPDGQRVTFSHNRDTYVISSDGSGRSLLIKDGELWCWREMDRQPPARR